MSNGVLQSCIFTKWNSRVYVYSFGEIILKPLLFMLLVKDASGLLWEGSIYLTAMRKITRKDKLS